ncbi:hypothetical protein B0H67DRAFT_564979 [Lasiosphaeris hirsuta]|uniref:Uncharacterized protein n=1 Tax=Lasiosphaeris hirsuta TaxID=260670 RepID=A0AA40BC15_9PEZI|nr:hypothetical protein B0H67DRAFT_564979 [Lasiosphaeris hirsuta]
MRATLRPHINGPGELQLASTKGPNCNANSPAKLGASRTASEFADLGGDSASHFCVGISLGFSHESIVQQCAWGWYSPGQHFFRLHLLGADIAGLTGVQVHHPVDEIRRHQRPPPTPFPFLHTDYTTLPSPRPPSLFIFCTSEGFREYSSRLAHEPIRMGYCSFGHGLVISSCGLPERYGLVEGLCRGTVRLTLKFGRGVVG